MAEELKTNENQHVIKKRTSPLHQKRLSNKLSKPDVHLSGRKRTVFIDLTGFYKCWRSIPSDILFDALLIFPNVYKEWIFKPYIYLNPFNDILGDDVFVKLLQWKYQQGLLCVISMHINNTNDSRIHPFWRYLSDKLIEIEDCVTFKTSKYNPLILNTKYYCSTFYKSKYVVSSNDILSELYSLTMKMDAIKEILYESNPSLNVIIKYSPNHHVTNDDDDLLEELSEINCKDLLLLNIDSLTMDIVSNHDHQLNITPLHDSEVDDILNEIDTAWNNTNIDNVLSVTADSLTADIVSNHDHQINITPLHDSEVDDILNEIDTAWNN